MRLAAAGLSARESAWAILGPKALNPRGLGTESPSEETLPSLAFGGGDGFAVPMFRWPHFRCPRMAGLNRSPLPVITPVITTSPLSEVVVSDGNDLQWEREYDSYYHSTNIVLDAFNRSMAPGAAITNGH